jgi:hypothetical protein
MTPISRRLYKLEKRLAPRLGEEGPKIAEIIRERRHRRLLAQGRTSEKPGLAGNEVGSSEYEQTIGASMRKARFERRALLMGTPNHTADDKS